MTDLIQKIVAFLKNNNYNFKEEKFKITIHINSFEVTLYVYLHSWDIVIRGKSEALMIYEGTYNYVNLNTEIKVVTTNYMNENSDLNAFQLRVLEPLKKYKNLLNYFIDYYLIPLRKNGL
jgi:hypothetical protein